MARNDQCGEGWRKLWLILRRSNQWLAAYSVLLQSASTIGGVYSIKCNVMKAVKINEDVNVEIKY